MSQGHGEETIEMNGRSIRPVLIASERTLSDYSACLRHLLVGLADESVPVGLVCPAGSNVESVVPIPIEVITHPAYDLPLLWIQNRKILLEKLDRFNPTVLHCLCEGKAAFTRKLSRQMNLPYVLTMNSLQPRRGQTSLSSSRCVKIIAPLKSISSSFTKKYPKLGKRVAQINMGTFVEDEVCCFNEENELANLITCFCGENPDVFLRFLGAVKRLSADGYKFMLVIVSEGRAERRLRKMLRDPVFSEIAAVVPRLEPWRSMLSAGDIFIRATASESFEPLLLEAMSVGNAVAGCKGGVDDLIVDGKTAAVFNTNNEADVYATLKGLMEDREVARRLAKSAQDYLRKKHTVSGMVSATLEVYRQSQNSEI